ncbi:FAD-dependent monooxygenase [Paenibacillus sp. JNUCC31]|uniref:FAD-dependent oxidoreductase n=1 Tax=Paenibacillus sp. JNUCC-31 TaxID=2777983 RepID=UPI00177F8479|nr:FAD-dependent monooxygenase [Paenibacillus sp. JNUCC-31]QOS79439.1 FAD-dependent monooxygenase [Paenibacillus sp. JNUCC-31]
MRQKIIIIGAGISGLSLAIFLKKAGIDCAVYENYPYKRIEGSSFRINKSGVHVMKELGIEEQIKKSSHSADRMRLLTTDNTEIASINLMQHSTFSKRSIYMQRSDLIEILMSQAKSSGVEIHYSKKLTSFSQDASSVTACFDDGHQEMGSLLVGADGLHSTVRNQMFPNHMLDYAKSWALYGIASSKDIDNEVVQNLMSGDELFYFTENANFLISKSHPTNELNLSWQSSGYQERKIPKEEFEFKNLDEIKSDLLQRYGEHGALSEIIKKSFNIIPKQIYCVDPIPSWSKGRVVVIGDSAHTINPNTGYGCSVALEDAMYLAKLLKKHHYTDALYYLEADRKDRINAIQNTLEIFDVSKGFDFSNGFDIGLFSGSTIDPNYKIDWED